MKERSIPVALQRHRKLGSGRPSLGFLEPQGS